MCYDSHNMTDKQRPFMTTGEIVQFAKVHPNTVALWRATGKILPKDKIGSTLLYDRLEIMNFLDKRSKKKNE